MNTNTTDKRDEYITQLENNIRWRDEQGAHMVGIIIEGGEALEKLRSDLISMKATIMEKINAPGDN